MSRLPDDRSESVFTDFKPAYTKDQALLEANRCLYCEDAPCIQACPTEIDVPTFIRKIATDNVYNSARTIFDSNIMGMSCARVCPVEVLCVGSCVFNEMDAPPIQIGKLQRYATDMAFEEGWAYYEAGPATGKSVGIVGAGPAGLAAAHRLRRFGHAVTIYEKRDVLGGLNTTGIAPYKMPADRSEKEVEWLLSIGGIEIKTGISVPNDISWADLEAQHDALFLGFGLGPDSRLAGEGADLAGVEGAVDWIEAMKTTKLDLSSVKNVAVIGGGNTALDAVREALGLGIDSVTMVYRGNESRMTGYKHEWAAAKVENASVAWKTQPTGFVGSDGKVTGVSCVLLNDDKKPIAGSEHVIQADLVLLAIGQSKLGDIVSGLDGIEVEWGRILTADDGATGRSGVWAGGDAANGGKEVVNGVAEGRDAAISIHRFLSQGDV